MTVAVALALALFGGADFGLSEPVRLKAGKDDIDVEHGHAAPILIDFDGDGKRDLVVGQFEGGKARIYLNKGTDTAPRFDGFTFLQAGGTEAKVSYG